jgi:hypothetical protein
VLSVRVGLASDLQHRHSGTGAVEQEVVRMAPMGRQLLPAARAEMALYSTSQAQTLRTVQVVLVVLVRLPQHSEAVEVWEGRAETPQARTGWWVPLSVLVEVATTTPVPPQRELLALS